LDEFGNYKLDEDVEYSLDDIKEKARKLKDVIDGVGSQKHLQVKEK